MAGRQPASWLNASWATDYQGLNQVKRTGGQKVSLNSKTAGLIICHHKAG